MKTINEAKKFIAAELKKGGFNNRLSGRVISFTDLIRESGLFITIHGWIVKPDLFPYAQALKKTAGDNGTIVEFKTLSPFRIHYILGHYMDPANRPFDVKEFAGAVKNYSREELQYINPYIGICPDGIIRARRPYEDIKRAIDNVPEY